LARSKRNINYPKTIRLIKIKKVYPKKNMATKGKKVYFPNLDGLRFIAALLVIIHHIELNKGEMGLANVFGNGVDADYQIGTLESFVHVIGKLGVVLFFSLSGFLIIVRRAEMAVADSARIYLLFGNLQVLKLDLKVAL